jgi:hypothetical protein
LNSTTSGAFLPNWKIRLSWINPHDAYQSTVVYSSSAPIATVINGTTLFVSLQSPAFNETICPADAPRIFLSMLVQPVQGKSFCFCRGF